MLKNPYTNDSLTFICMKKKTGVFILSLITFAVVVVSALPDGVHLVIFRLVLLYHACSLGNCKCERKRDLRDHRETVKGAGGRQQLCLIPYILNPPPSNQPRLPLAWKAKFQPLEAFVQTGTPNLSGTLVDFNRSPMPPSHPFLGAAASGRVELFQSSATTTWQWVCKKQWRLLQK